jgi:L-cysteine desulfidase
VKCFAGNDHGGLLAAQNDFVSAHLKILIAGNCVLCCFNYQFTNKINKITNKINKMTKNFIGFVCDFIDFPCEFSVKTTEHTVASYESSNFT